MADSFIRFPGGRYKAVTLSYDDGSFQDERLAAVMRAHGLKGTFNLNSGRFTEGRQQNNDPFFRMPSREEVKRRYGCDSFEVATHALTHPFLEQLTPAQAAYEIVEDRKNLEQLMGYAVRGHAYPYGTHNEAVRNCLRACGIVYARTVVSTHSFALPQDWLQLNPTCHHADPALPELTESFLADFAPDAPFFRRKAKFFYVWGHSFEFDRADNWNVIEEFAARIGGREDVWYCTNIEAYEYVQAFRNLIYTADGTLVRNASSIPVWLEREGCLYKIPAGECVSF